MIPILTEDSPFNAGGQAFFSRKNRSCLLGVPLLAALLVSGHVAYAQELPGSVDPMKLQERMQKPAPAAGVGPEFVPAGKQKQGAAPPIPKEGFILKAVVVEGNTVLFDEEFEPIYHDRLGVMADLPTLQYFAEQITQLYHRQGYFLSKAVVPEQDASAGTARLVVVEGYVSRVRLEGAALEGLKKKDVFSILERIPERITAMRPLHGPTLETLLLRMNELYGINIQALMEPLPKGEAEPGAIGMTIQVEKLPASRSLGIDNFGSRYAGPVEMTASAVSANNLLAFDQASMSLLTTWQTSEVQAVSAEYSLPLNEKGTSLDLRAGYSTLEPGFTLEPLGVESESYNANIQLVQNLFRSRKTNLNATAGLDFANITTDFSGANLYKDKIRALRLGVNYEKATPSGANSGGMTFSQGLDLLGARQSDFNASRAGGRSDFTKFTANFSRLQQLGLKWQAYGSVIGQYSRDTLLSSEEFGYGGQSFGRAYDPYEITGDRGIAAALELRYSGLPEYYKTYFQPFAFYDVGKVWKPGAAANEQEISAASAGLGLKFLYDQMFNGYLAVALPLTKPADAPPSYADEKDPRFLFQFSSNF